MNARVAVFAALGLWVSSCSCAPPPCTTASDCSSGQQCIDNQCLQPCSDAAPCSGGNTCAGGFCRAACTANTDCGGDQACAGGACRPKSCGAQTCAPESVCIDGQCTAAACAGVICPAGQRCANGACLSTSCGGVPCGGGQVCVDNVCADAACLGVVCPGNTVCLSGQCLSPGDPLPYSLVCDAMAQGYKNAFNQGPTRCTSLPLTEADLAHLPFLSINSGLSTRPTSATMQTFSALFTCGAAGADGGFFAAALAPLDQSVDAGRVRYDGLKARACINAGYSPDAGYAGACHEVFTPLVTPGGACARTEECPNDHFCKPSAYGTCSGSCVPRLPDGVDCEPSRDLCANGSCQLEGTAYRCRPQTAADGGSGGEGATCSPGSTSGCASTLRCVRNPSGPLLPDGGQSGLCTAPVGLGGACAISSSAGPACSGTCLTCYSTDGITGICRPRSGSGGTCRLDADCEDFHLCLSGACQPMGKPGEACLVSANGARGSCLWGDTYCRQGSPDAGLGVCTAIPTQGQACGNRYDLTSECATGTCLLGLCQPTPTLGQPCTGTCAGELRCETRDGGPPTCHPLRGQGEACSTSSQCNDQTRCSGGFCVARFAAGSVCAADSECLSDNCLEGAKVCAETCFSPLTPGQSYSPGCPGGLRDWAILLAFSSLALAVRGRRRR